MGFLSKLFRKKSVDIVVEPTSRAVENPECNKLLSLKAYMNSLLSDNRYIPKSEYRARLLDEKKIVEYFAVLENSGMLGSFCQTNGVDEKEIQDTFSCYSHFKELIDAHNDSFITRAMSEEKKKHKAPALPITQLPELFHIFLCSHSYVQTAQRKNRLHSAIYAIYSVDNPLLFSVSFHSPYRRFLNP